MKNNFISNANIIEFTFIILQLKQINWGARVPVSLLETPREAATPRTPFVRERPVPVAVRPDTQLVAWIPAVSKKSAIYS